MKRHHHLATLTLAAALLSPFAASADSGAQSFVKERQTKLTALLKQGKTADPQIAKVFDGMLDYELLAKESLRQYWDGLETQERTEFRCVLKHLVRDAYRKNLQKTMNYAVTFEGGGPAKKGYLVKTVAKSRKDKRADPVSIDYVVVKKGAEYRVGDIVTEGSSLVGNYRSQFRRIIKKKGFKELKLRMKNKLEKNGTKVDCG